MKKKLGRINTFLKKPLNLYIALGLFSSLVLITIIFLSGGDLMDEFFFWDIRDSGMDFFHSIEFLKGNNPYQNFKTLYPPLANLFFKFLYTFVSDFTARHLPGQYVSSAYLRGTYYDSRTYQSMMISFILVLMFFVGFVSYVIGRYFSKETNLKKHLLLYCFITSYGIITAIERGNIVMFCAPLLLMFVELRKSSNKYYRIVSIVLLAIVAGLKLYPALFGIILLKDKDYSLAIKAIVLGILSVLIPMLFFDGGYFDNFKTWIDVVINFSSSDSRMANLILALEELPIPIYIIEIHMTILKYLIILEMLICIILEKREYNILLYISTIVYLINGDIFYSLSYFLVPLICFIKEEETICKENIVSFVVMLLLTIPMPVFGVLNKTLFFSIVIFILAIYCGLIIMNKVFRHAKNKLEKR